MVGAQNPLIDYVKSDDQTTGWEVAGRRSIPGDPPVNGFEMRLTSQTWHGTTWTHGVYLVLPERVGDRCPLLLFVVGGELTSDRWRLAGRVAAETDYAVAVLDRVPNQPLFDGYVEDELVAHTFDRFIETGDPTWPLLLPMTRAAVKAMDTVSEVMNEQLGTGIRPVVVGGASKRGWTAWLTSVVDLRVWGLIPMVYDNLDIPRQLRDQVRNWGSHSDRISPYTDRNLHEKLDSDRGRELVQMVDPYTYRGRLTSPVLNVSATNDHYWRLNAAEQYLDDLPAPVFRRYLPNTGHGLNRYVPGLVRTVEAMLLHADERLSLPDVDSSIIEEGSSLRFVPDPGDGPRPEYVRVWHAEASNGDFRDADWRSTSMEIPEENGLNVAISPDQLYVGLFGQMGYNVDHRKFTLSTRMHVHTS